MAVHGRYVVEVGLYVLIAAGIVITGQVVYGWRKPVMGLLSEEAVDVAELVAEHDAVVDAVVLDVEDAHAVFEVLGCVNEEGVEIQVAT